MIKPSFAFLISVICLAFICLFLAGANSGEQQKKIIEAVVEKLTSDNASSIQRGKLELKELRDSLTKHLALILNDAKSKKLLNADRIEKWDIRRNAYSNMDNESTLFRKNLVAAINLCEEYRISELASVLSEFLELGAEKLNDAGLVGGGRNVAWRYDFPAIGALISIGLPSVDPILLRVSKSDSHRVTNRAAIALQGILGVDMAITVVRDRLKGFDNTIERKRINAVIDFLISEKKRLDKIKEKTNSGER